MFNRRRIVVAQLAQNTTESDLEHHFQAFGEIEKSFIVLNKSDAVVQPYGHIIFKSDKGAANARKCSNHVIRGKQVTIKVHKINIQRKLGSEKGAFPPVELNQHNSDNKPLFRKRQNILLQDSRVKLQQPSVNLNFHQGVRKNLRDSLEWNQFGQASYPGFQAYDRLWSQSTLTQVTLISSRIEELNHFEANLKLRPRRFDSEDNKKLNKLNTLKSLNITSKRGYGDV